MGGGDEQSVEGEDETSSRLDQVALEELGETKEVRSCLKRKQRLGFSLFQQLRDSTLTELKDWLQSQVCLKNIQI